MNSFPLLLIVTLFIIISSLIINCAQNDKNNFDEIIKNRYCLNSLKILLFSLIGLFNLVLFNYLFDKVNLVFNYLLTIIIANFFIFILSFLLLKKVYDNNYIVIIKKFKILIYIINIIVFPLSLFYTILEKIFFGLRKKKMTESEFLDIIDKAEEDDSINENEVKLIKSVLDFDNLNVEDILTPRIDVVGIKKGSSIEKIINKFHESGYSRLPLFDENIDNIIGIINHKDFYNRVYIKKESLEKIIQKPIEVSQYMSINNLLKTLKSNKSHMAIVKDEYSGTIGIVTMEDILEELVGDIWDEHDKISQNIKQVFENKYYVLGTTYLEELNDIEGINILETDEYSTVNGWVLFNLGKMGVKDDFFVYDNLIVKVLNASNKMILEVEIEIKKDQ